MLFNAIKNFYAFLSKFSKKKILNCNAELLAALISLLLSKEEFARNEQK